MKKAYLLIAALTAPVLAAVPAPASAATTTPAAPRYAMADVGTLGGPQAFINLPGIPITSDGAVLGTADTTEADADFPNFNPFIVFGPNPTLVRAFTWRNGDRVDLGALPGNNMSAVFQVNGNGVGAGLSETGAIDPITGYPAEHAVLFHDRVVTDLGTLPGGNESQAFEINARGQVAGFSSNGIPDPVSFFGWGLQVRSFIWQNGVMSDLGSLGGPDTVLAALNARGQIAGDSFTNATPNPTTGVPTRPRSRMCPFAQRNGWHPRRHPELHELAQQPRRGGRTRQPRGRSVLPSVPVGRFTSA